MSGEKMEPVPVLVTEENEANLIANINSICTTQVKIPCAGDRVYKDECVYSFDTPESETGLYISLNSFLGVGRDQLEGYYKRSSDSLYLHYRRIKIKVPKPQNKDGPEKKVTRLAIGVEDGFDAGRDFDYEISEYFQLAVLPQFHLIKLPNSKLSEKVSSCIAAIQAAESAARLAELEALAGTWDGEIRAVSKHAENLVQLKNDKKIPPKGWRCEAEGCILTENLWLNLTDGSILCGRRFFNGTGGNNHAIEHYKKCKYPLAVKLGTITKTGTGDVYSYDEDDMVEDPKLVQHLAKFGINVAVLEKTDKSMVEMEIELNQRQGEWNDIQEAGSKLTPLYGPGFTGLMNLGNTCYLNSVVQVLFSVSEFQKRYLENASKFFETSRDPVNDLNVQMSKLCIGLLSGKYSDNKQNGEEQSGINPQMFRSLIGKGHVEFSTKKQQDAQEFFLHLITTVERQCRLDASPTDCFKFEVEDKVICDITGMVRYMQRTEYCVPLPIPLEAAINKAEVIAYEKKKADAEAEGRRLPLEELVRPRVSFDSCLQAFAALESVQEFRSSGARQVCSASKTARLKTFPDCLVIQLKKFMKGEDWLPKKLDVSVDIPHSLDISFLRAQGIQPNEVVLPDEAVEIKKAPAIDELVVNHIIEMGFHKNAARKAVIHTGNSGSQAATNWIMEHMDDADLNDPIQDESLGVNDSFIPNADSVKNIESMGFTADQATKALQATDNNMQRAIDWIFSRQDELDAAANNVQQAKYSDGVGKYNLLGFISHMGTSSMVGHYVCHILKDGKWAIFNDNKVALSENLPKDLGYLYFYKRAV